MKSLAKTSLLIFLGLFFLTAQTVKGQSIKLFFGDLLNGAVTGTALGGATMALQDSDELGPLRVGAGAGILFGAGVGLYDVTSVQKGQPFYISGTFNSGRNSTILVLLDTFYGAAAGAALGAAVTLIADEPIVNGLQYGAGAGAWIGFGFGLIDSFILAERPEELMATTRPSSSVRGLLRYSSDSGAVKIGLIHPSLMSQPVIKEGVIKSHYSAGIELVNVDIAF